MRIDEAQDALERFGEMTECLQYGSGWSCTMPATPEGSSRVIGRDDRGAEVWMRRYRCVAGHRYDAESASPRIEVENGPDVDAAAQVSGSAACLWT